MIFASFDIDGTLVNTYDLISLAFAERGFMLDTNNVEYDFKFIDGQGPPPDFQWDLFFYRLFTERFDEIKPIDDYVYEFLKKIYKDGSEPVRTITARPSGMLMHHCCSELLKRLFPDIDFSIDVVGSGSEKYRYMLGSDIMFEDRRKTAIELSKKGIIVFVRKAEYNFMEESGNVCYLYNLECDLRELSPGSIILYDNFENLLCCGVDRLAGPF
jgi:phosphoglycolate phosphatase-like HAD superfamily hydrolase